MLNKECKVIYRFLFKNINWFLGRKTLMDYKRARKFPKNKITGKFPSQKMGRMCYWESGLERDFFLCLEFDESVLEFFEQPPKVSFLLNEKERKYFPDVMVQKENGKLFVEVKASERLQNPELVERYRAIRQEASKRGYPFYIVTEVEIYRGSYIDNLKLLFRYSREKADEQVRVAILNILTLHGKLSIRELIASLILTGCERPLPAIYSLLWEKVLIFSCLENPISLETVILIPAKGAEILEMSTFASWHDF